MEEYKGDEKIYLLVFSKLNTNNNQTSHNGAQTFKNGSII